MGMSKKWHHSRRPWRSEAKSAHARVPILAILDFWRKIVSISFRTHVIWSKSNSSRWVILLFLQKKKKRKMVQCSEWGILQISQTVQLTIFRRTHVKLGIGRGAACAGFFIARNVCSKAELDFPISPKKRFYSPGKSADICAIAILLNPCEINLYSEALSHLMMFGRPK